MMSGGNLTGSTFKNSTSMIDGRYFMLAVEDNVFQSIEIGLYLALGDNTLVQRNTFFQRIESV